MAQATSRSSRDFWPGESPANSVFVKSHDSYYGIFKNYKEGYS